MLSPDSFPGQRPDDHDALWRGAEDLIDRLDRRSRDSSAASGFEMEVSDSLRKFSSASGVLIYKRTDHETVVIAKSGISVFQTDDFQAKDSDQLIDHDASGEKRLVVTRSLTTTSDLEIQLCFDQRPTEQQERVFTETTRALTDVLLPVVLRREINSLSNALQSVSSDHRLAESFFAGATANETYRSIAKTLATLTHTDRVSIIRSNRRRYSNRTGGNTGQLVATSVPTDIDPRAQQARSLGQLVQDTELQSQYARQYDVPQLHVKEISDSKHQVQAWIVFEQYSKSNEELGSIADRFAPYQDLTHRAVQSVVARDLATPDSIAKVFTGFTSVHWAKIAAATGIVFLALWFVKIPMRLSVPGRIAAASRITKHSPTNGFVTKVHVTDGDRVTKGTPLAELHSPELELVAQRLSSELATTTTKIDTLQSSKRDAAANPTSAQRMVLKTEADGIRRQLELVRQEQQALVLRSNHDGIVRQWDAEETLAGRVVVIGQPLLEIIDPSAGWIVELDIPDAQIGYLIKKDSAQPPCSFRLLSSPTQVHHGLVDHIDRAAQLSETGQSIVRATIPISPDQASGFRRGASVVAKVDCGRRSAAFVLFRGLVQWWRCQQWF